MCACAPALRVLFRQYFKEPLSRAVQSGSSRNRSGNRSTNRDSKHVDTKSTSDAMDMKGTGDNKLLEHSAKQSMGTVDEREVGSFSSTTPTEPNMAKEVKTPADYEAYALQSLERYRTDSYNRAPTRYRDDYIMQPREDPAQQQYHARTTNQYIEYRPTNAPYTQYERPRAPYTQWNGAGTWLDSDSG